MTGKSLESQLRVRLIHLLLQCRGHNTIDFTYFGQNVERLDAQAVPTHLGVVRGVQVRSRGRREHTTGPAPQQASGAAVTVPPAWLPLCQQPYGDIDSADRRCGSRARTSSNLVHTSDLVLLCVACQWVRQDHEPSCTTPIYPGKRGPRVYGL